jgi:hypothetical protein
VYGDVIEPYPFIDVDAGMGSGVPPVKKISEFEKLSDLEVTHSEKNI